MSKQILKLYALVCVILCSSALLVSCGSDDDDKKFDDVILTAGQSYTIPSGSSISWTSSNELIAKVSNGVVSALRVGEVKITSSEGSFKVTVNASLDLYREPYLQFGASKSSVKSYMSGYTLSDEDDEALIYDGKGIEAYQLYTFKNSAMNAAAVIVYVSAVSTSDLATYLSERYVYLGTTSDSEIMMLKSIDEKVVIGVTAKYLNKKPIYMILYADATSTSSMPAIEQLDERFSLEDMDGALQSEFSHFEKAIIGE